MNIIDNNQLLLMINTIVDKLNKLSGKRKKKFILDFFFFL